MDPQAATADRRAVERDLATRLGSVAEARWLVDHVFAGGSPGAEDLAAIDALSARRLAGEPLQYVLGTWAFRTLELTVDRRALIPRPETEQVVEVALAELGRVGAGRPTQVVDLGTGSGAVALSVAVEAPASRVWATDVDVDALALAGDNRARVAAAHPSVAERVELCRGSWYDALPSSLRGRVDLVVANPPYVAEDEWATLDDEVRAEPAVALVAGAGSDGTPGLAGVEAVLAGARAWLAKPGAVVIELAPHQADAAADLAAACGLDQVRVEPDLAGRPRALVGRTG